ncbi:hypothetical protein GCM10020255_004350 [Rhodococcus baikonurensis]
MRTLRKQKLEQGIAVVFDTMHTVSDELPPSYNVAPTQPVRVILERTSHEEPDAEPQRQLRTAKWGLLPAWAKDARSETVTEKPSFRSSAAKRRAIIPADGYYEWMKMKTERRFRSPFMETADHPDNCDPLGHNIFRKPFDCCVQWVRGRTSPISLQPS